MSLRDKITRIDSFHEFETIAMEVFRLQSEENRVYRDFIQHMGIPINAIQSIHQIPFLPIGFFKEKKISTGTDHTTHVFTSSGTTGSIQSKHYIADIALYEASFKKCFEVFYGSVSDYCILALLPSYLEREGSSLVYMVDQLIKESKHAQSGFYLQDYDALVRTLVELDNKGQKTMLLGVTYALLDLVERKQLELKNTIVMETGGMKGKRKEMIREELHRILCSGFGVKKIHSEYGMTELLSQAYSTGDGIFTTPPWMKILIRDVNDPLEVIPIGRTGGINVIDLANLYSCSFIATQDLGKLHNNGTFEVLGRFDNSDVRGCNLMLNGY